MARGDHGRMHHTNVAAREDRSVIAGFRISAAAFGLTAAVLLGRGEAAQPCYFFTGA